MRKKSLKLVKSILAEAVGDPQTGSHTWDIPHPQTAWEGLSAEQQAHVHSLNQRGRIHPEGHLHGWRPGTGPLFQRDFTGRSSEDYRNLHKRYKQELIDAGHDKKSAHETAARFISTDRQRAHEAGVMAHETAMRPIREQQKKQRQAAQNISGARQQHAYKNDSEMLFHSAMKGASDSADYFRTGAEAERENHWKTMFRGNKADAEPHVIQSHEHAMNALHPQMSDEAKKHISALTDMSRSAIHGVVLGGIHSAGKHFSNDAMKHWNATFSGMRPKDANINNPLDIVHSLLTPQSLNGVLHNYTSNPRHSMDHKNRAQFARHSSGNIDNDQKLGLPYSIVGAQDPHDLRTHIPNYGHEFHPSVRHLNLSDKFYLDTRTSLIGLYGGDKESPFKTNDNIWEREIPGEQKHQSDYRKLIGAGLKHIWSIPNISDHDRVLLHRHFESQLRHHHVAAVANPKMFDQYHRSMETARREREQAKREEQQRQRQSSGGSSSGGSSGGRRRRGEWPHTEKPHEVLGVASDASASDVRRAYRKLAAQHHPDAGGDPAMFIKAKDAHDHMMSRLNEWIVMLAEWVSKRYKK